MKMHLPQALLLSLGLLGWVPAAAQVGDAVSEDVIPPTVVDARAGRTPVTHGGRIGQRQTREDAAREAGVEPMARINNRIANRIQARRRARIDPSYDPQADAASPFAIAEEQTRKGSSTPR
jgi:hypothetical protein